jgi:hypothetical protein
MCDTYTWQNNKHNITDKPILSSERMWRKDYDSKGSVKKKKKEISGRARFSGLSSF